MLYAHNRKKKFRECLFPGGFKRIAMVVLIASVFALPSGVPAANPQPFDITKLTIENKAPDFVLTDLNGQKFRLSDHKGKRPVLLIFSTTWCTFCQGRDPPLQIPPCDLCEAGAGDRQHRHPGIEGEGRQIRRQTRAALPHPAGRGRHGKRRLRSPGGSDDDPRRQKRHDRLPPVPHCGYPAQDDDEKISGRRTEAASHISGGI